MNRLFLLLRNILVVFTLIPIFTCCDKTPAIIFMSPRDGQQYFRDEDISVKVIAADLKGKTTLVQLYVDNILHGELSEYPYYFTIKAGTVDTGTHFLNVMLTNNGKQVESYRSIYVKEVKSESDDFVTFTNGKIPPEWTVTGWNISTLDGIDDHYSLFTYTNGATVSTSKKCSKITFYMKGSGSIKLNMDGKNGKDTLFSSNNANSPIFPDWTLYEFSCPRAYHTFTWEFMSNVSLTTASLDAIRFEL